MAVTTRKHGQEPAHVLLLLAASGPSSSTSAVDQILHVGFDWTSVVELALQHRMVPNVLAALELAHPSLVQPEILGALQSYCQTLHAQSDKTRKELFALIDTLAMRGVNAVPFKGPVLGELLVSHVGQRSAGDIDLLMRPEDVRTARAVLEAQGYEDAGRVQGVPPLTSVQRRLYEHFQCEYQYAREADDMVVEPHWNLSQRPLAIDVDYLGMLDRARPVTLFGRSVLTLAPDDLLVALCIHGSKHHWQRLAWIRDIAGVLTVFPDIDLQHVLRQARARGYARLLLLSLAVAREYAGAPLASDIIRIIDSDRTLVSLMDEVGRSLFEVEPAEPRNDRIEPFRLRMRERWSDRLRYALRTLTTPRRHHLEMVSLPAGLSWGYYPLKLGIDYACLPAWELLKACRIRIAPKK